MPFFNQYVVNWEGDKVSNIVQFLLEALETIEFYSKVTLFKPRNPHRNPGDIPKQFGKKLLREEETAVLENFGRNLRQTKNISQKNSCRHLQT